MHKSRKWLCDNMTSYLIDIWKRGFLKGCSQFRIIRPNLMGILGHFPNRPIPFRSYWGHPVLDRVQSIMTTLVDFIRLFGILGVAHVATIFWKILRTWRQYSRQRPIIWCNHSRVVTPNYSALVQIAFQSEKQRYYWLGKTHITLDVDLAIPNS